MHDDHSILTNSTSMYSFWSGNKSHLPTLIIAETSAGIERAFGTAMLILNDRQS